MVAEQFYSFSSPEGPSGEALAEVPARWGKAEIKVKFMHRGLRRGRSAAAFLRQFPGSLPQWRNCLFTFDVDCREYDWLVVYQDLPRGDSFLTEERLACPRQRTLLITGEPSTITVFGRDYLRQFGWVLTFQEPWAMRHPGAIFHHPGLMWHYGLPFSGGEFISWDQLAATAPLPKSRAISTVCSQRTGRVTLHSARVDFTGRLQEDFPELDVYGHGVKPMNDKAEALEPYRYHVAVENHVYDHHLTEKLPDAFLGYTLPFYHGAPNADRYFPKESFVAIDINDYRRTREIIAATLAANEYQDRLPYIVQARRLVLEQENLFAIVSREIASRHHLPAGSARGQVIRNRPTMRLKNPLAGLRSLGEKMAIKTYHRLTYSRRNKSRGL